MIKTLLLLLMLSSSFAVMAQSPDLSQMTEEEKQLTGLHKLSASELNALSDWINNEQIKIERKTRVRNAGFEARRQNQNRSTIQAILEKQYTDKLGRTYYELDNGQIWKSVSSGSIYLKNDGRQLVTIEPAALGSWSMRGDGNSSTKVKRMK